MFFITNNVIVAVQGVIKRTGLSAIRPDIVTKNKNILTGQPVHPYWFVQIQVTNDYELFYTKVKAEDNIAIFLM